jgi:hypothetical protein
MIRKLQPILSKQFKFYYIQKTKFSSNDNTPITTEKRIMIIDKKLDILNNKIDIVLFGGACIVSTGIGYIGALILEKIF